MSGKICRIQASLGYWQLASFLLIAKTIIIYTFWSQNLLIAHAEGSTQNKSESKNATDPLIYKRLRFDDDFLQVYRRFQKHLSADESKITFKVNETLEDNKTKLVEYSYYVNPKIESTSLSQDDMIFEALDRTYLTRLFPAYLYNYDDKRDIPKASDPAIVSPKRCDKEMNFLMEQLSVIANVRFNGAKTGLQLNNALSPELLALFDSFGMEEPGLLLGNYLWPGNWRQCKKSLIFHRDNSNLTNSVEFKTRFCYASLRSKRWDKMAAERVTELEAIDYFKYSSQKYDYARFHRVSIGLCLPESCDSRLIEHRREDLHKLAVHKLSEPLRSYDLVHLYCLPDETSKLRELEPSGKLFVVCSILWLLVIIICSVLDYRRKQAASRLQMVTKVKTNGGGGGSSKPVGFVENLIDAMSFQRNFDRLFETRSCQVPPRQQSGGEASSGKHLQVSDGRIKPISERNKPAASDLFFLNCIKVLTTPTIIFGHGGMIYKQLDRYALDYHCLSKLVAAFHFSAVFFVDWYFVITGFLTTYIMFASRKVERNDLTGWIHMIVHRYWRLAPIYLILIWYMKSVFMYTGSGPVWDYASNNMTYRSVCRRESWIYPLTLTSNLHPIHEECLSPTWYISCDFQFYLITPFVLLLLYKNALMGWLVTLGAIGACIALRLHLYMTNPKVRPLELMRPRYDLYMRNNWDLHPTYIYPHYRVASYLIGILAGHYSYMVLSGQWQSLIYYDRAGATASSPSSSPSSNGKVRTAREDSRMRQRKNVLRWIVFCAGIYVSLSMMFATGVLSDLFPVAWEPHVKYFTAVTYSISHSVASTAFAVLLITIMFGHVAWLKRWMSLPIWTVLSRINYFIFLGQIEAMFWFTQSADRLLELNNLELFKGFFASCGFLYPLSVVLTVLVELPLAQIERNFISPLFHRSTATSRHALTGTPSSPGPTRRNNAPASLTGGGCISSSSSRHNPTTRDGPEAGAACELTPMGEGGGVARNK